MKHKIEKWTFLLLAMGLIFGLMYFKAKACFPPLPPGIYADYDFSANPDGIRIQCSSPDATYIILERSTTGEDSDWTELSGNWLPNYDNFDESVLPDTFYYYRARAANVHGISDYSDIDSAIVPSVPLAPSNLSASVVSDTEIELAWRDNSWNEDGFCIYRSTDGTSFSLVDSVSANVTTYSNTTNLNGGTRYYFYVCAWNNEGYFVSENTNVADAEVPVLSWNAALNTENLNLTWITEGDAAWFIQDITTHDSVSAGKSGGIGNDQHSDLKTTMIGPGTVSFYWLVDSEDTEGDEDYLQVYVDNVWQGCIYGVAGWDLASIQFGSGQHEIKWRYSKSASGSSGEDCGWLDQVSFAPSALTAPTGLTATAVSSAQINLAWTDNAFAESGYKIERSTDGTNFTEIATIALPNAVSFQDTTGLNASTQYHYRVRAYYNTVLSNYSDTANATTSAGSGIIDCQ